MTKRKEIFKSTYRVNKGFTATINAGKTQTFILAVDTLGILDSKHGFLNEYARLVNVNLYWSQEGTLCSLVTSSTSMTIGYASGGALYQFFPVILGHSHSALCNVYLVTSDT